MSVKALWSLSIITRLLLWGWTTNFRGVYRKGVATWLNTAPSFSRAKILPEKMQFVTKFPLEAACETSTNRVSVAVVSIFSNKSHVLGDKSSLRGRRSKEEEGKTRRGGKREKLGGCRLRGIPHFSVIYLWNDAGQHGTYLFTTIKRQNTPNCDTSHTQFEVEKAGFYLASFPAFHTRKELQQNQAPLTTTKMPIEHHNKDITLFPQRGRKR